MKTVVIYHSIYLDGWMSAAIVKHWFTLDKSNFIVGERDKEGFLNVNSIEFIGYNYGQPIPDLSEYDKVIMCDISFPYERMKELMSKFGTNFIWIDHHISAINDCFKFGSIPMAGIRDTKFAACELTWNYFFPNQQIPEIVRLLGRYDCFGHKGTSEEQKVLEFQYGARQMIFDYETAYNNLKINLVDNEIIDIIRDDGSAIYSYLCTEAAQSYKNGFTVYLDYGHMEGRAKFICINKERFNPINFDIDYHKDGYDGAACFHYANDKWNFSLYNDNGLVDCSVIAKQFGGGGHKGAAGFVIDDLNKIIK